MRLRPSPRRGTRAAAKANVVSGSSAMQRAERQHAEAEPQPVHERLDRDLDVADCCRRVELRHDDVEVLGERAADRDFRRRLDPRASGRTSAPDTSW